MTFPILLGRGKSIYDGLQDPGAFRLAKSHVSDKGVTFTIYEPNGEVETGTFATKPPSEDELKLRERIKEGAW